MIAEPLRSGWLLGFARWLTPRRLRAQATILALGLWGVCLYDFATSGLFDRAGNIKFQDFLQFPISANLIATGRSLDLYNDQVLADAIRNIAGDNKVFLRYLYGPQVALPFVPLRRFSFLTQAAMWMTLSLLIYFACVYLIYRSCESLKPYSRFVVLCAVAYPPVFHFFVRGQLSAALVLCLTCSYLAFLSGRDWLAGIALGFLAFKPQCLVGVAAVLLVAGAWRVFAGLVLSAVSQLAFAFAYFGRAVIENYFTILIHSARQPASTELAFSPMQMHSLRSFWVLLVPSANAVWVLYALSCLAVMVVAARIWRSPTPLAIRFSALTLASVLVNPHLYIYDLLLLAPVFLLLADWLLNHPQHHSTPALRVFLYLAFLLPLFGPLAHWTHLQISVLAFAGLLCILHGSAIRTPQLASADSSVV